MVMAQQVLGQQQEAWSGLQLMQLLSLLALAGLMTALYLELADPSLIKWELKHG